MSGRGVSHSSRRAERAGRQRHGSGARWVPRALCVLGWVASIGSVRAEPGGPARAADDVSWRLGVALGRLATSGDFDVIGDRTSANQPGAAPLFGVRAAWAIVPTLELGVDVALAPAPTDGETAWLLPASVVLGWRPLDGAVTPIATVGGGVLANVAGAGDVDALITVGLGVEWRFADAWALRLDAAVLATDGVDKPLSFSPAVTIGIDLLGFGSSAEPDAVEPPLRDPRPTRVPLGCPAGADPARCLDSDGDQIIDAFDRCPTDRGPRPDGCPDPDGDGVRGLDDACPDRPGAPRDWGCPRP